MNGWFSDAASEIAEAKRLAQRAVELGNDDAFALAAGGYALVYVVRDLGVGAALIDRALILDSNLAEAWFYGGWVKTWLGEPELALERFARAMRLNPLDPRMRVIRAGTASAHFFLGRYDGAASWAAMALRDRPDYQPGLRIAAASNAMAGRPEQAHRAVARLRQLNPALRVSNLKTRWALFGAPKTSRDTKKGCGKPGCRNDLTARWSAVVTRRIKAWLPPL